MLQDFLSEPPAPGLTECLNTDIPFPGICILGGERTGPFPAEDAVANKQKVYEADFPLRDKAAVLIGCTAQEIANFVERTLKEFDLSRGQLNVLHFLDSAGRDTMTVNELRETLIDDSPNVSRLLNKMVDKGLVRKERQTDDQRIVSVSLTEKGRHLHHQADKKIGGHNVRLSPQECRQLIELLMKI